MKSSDRGISYESNPPALELTEGEIGGKYRGANCKPHYPRHIPITQPVVGLATPTAVPTSAEAMSTVSSRQQILDELTNTHLANIRHTLEHRLQVARAKGDQNLIRLLEAEAEQISC